MTGCLSETAYLLFAIDMESSYKRVRVYQIQRFIQRFIIKRQVSL